MDKPTKFSILVMVAITGLGLYALARWLISQPPSFEDTYTASLSSLRISLGLSCIFHFIALSVQMLNNRTTCTAEAMLELLPVSHGVFLVISLPLLLNFHMANNRDSSFGQLYLFILFTGFGLFLGLFTAYFIYLGYSSLVNKFFIDQRPAVK